MFDRSTLFGRARGFASRPLEFLLAFELRRARTRVGLIKRQFPSENARFWAQRLIEKKKSSASTLGGVGGAFGWLSLPADFAAMWWLEWSLLCDVAALYQTHTQSARSRSELLELFGYLEGVGPLRRVGPWVAVSVSKFLVRRGVFKTLGRLLPVLAIPLGAYWNRSHIEKVGLQAVRHFEGFSRASEKARQESDA